MTDEEKAQEYFLSLELEKGNKIFQLKEVIEKMWKVYLDGLAKGRKETTEKISTLEKENEQLKDQNTLFSTQLIACNERCKDLEKENEQLKCDLYNTEGNLQRMNIDCENLEKENKELKDCQDNDN